MIKTPGGYSKIAAIDETIKKQTTYTIVKLSRNKAFIANGMVVGTETLRDQKCTQKH